VLRSRRRGPSGAAPGEGVPSAENGTNWLADDIGVRYSSAVIAGAGDQRTVGNTRPWLGEQSLSAGSAQPGERAPHAWLRGQVVGLGAGRSPISTLDLFDGRFTLLSRCHSGAAQAVAQQLCEQGLPIAAVSVLSTRLDQDGDLPAVDHEFDRVYQLAAEETVLVRPDGYIAWRGSAGVGGSTGLRAAVSAALGGDLGVGIDTDRIDTNNQRRAG
jgi:hypothetical protein